MTAEVVSLKNDPCRETQELLPWFVTGQLDAEEHARAEAHLAQCPACQAELKFDRNLSQAIDGLPADVEQGWAAMQRRMAEPAIVRRGRSAVTGMRPRAAWVGWALAAQLAIVGVGGLLLIQSRAGSNPGDAYHVLGSKAVAPAGNLVVIFKPEASEAAVREALTGAKARVVDGPTTAGAYVLNASGRAQALAKLKASAIVVLAEPIDAARP